MHPTIKEAIREGQDDGILFSTGHKHHTWAKTFHSHPELYIQPRSLPEIEKIVSLARRCRRRVIVVGAAHSPSDLTSTSGWMVNLDNYSGVLKVDKDKSLAVVEAGIRLHDFGLALKKHGLAMPNLGSIDEQSIAGAISTGTHGSSLQHGLLSQSVIGLRITLANGRTVSCNATQNEELFRASLVSLGALGIIVEVTFKAVPTFDIEWHQSIVPLDTILSDWERGLWTQAEFVRVWWLPYTRRAIIWRADKTTSPRRAPKASSWYGSRTGSFVYHNLLYLGQLFPRALPWIEWFVFGMQYRFSNGPIDSAVGEARTSLLMDCLYSQFVNEWALPLHDGPAAIRALDSWLNSTPPNNVPFPSKGIYVHAPIEVRVSNTTTASPRPYLDPTFPATPTLYLNATLYRPYHSDPPARESYYAAFEHILQPFGARPHWAKNFSTRNPTASLDSADLNAWRAVRAKVDPDGVFVGDWLRRNVLGYPEASSASGDGSENDGYPPATMRCEEQEAYRIEAQGGGWNWAGEPALQQLRDGKSEDDIDDGWPVAGSDRSRKVLSDKGKAIAADDASSNTSSSSRPGSAGSYEIMLEAEAGSVFFEKKGEDKD